MAMVRCEASRRGLAGGGATVEVESDVKVVDVVDPPAAAVQGQLEPAAVLTPEQHARVEGVGGGEETQARSSRGLEDQARGDALAVEEVRAEKDLMLAGLAGCWLEDPVAE